MSAVDLTGDLSGYVIQRTERVTYLPVVSSHDEGKGHVGALIDALKDESDVVVVATVMSAKLLGMLERREFRHEVHYSAEMGEHVECMVWRR